MKKTLHVIKNHLMMMKYLIKFAPLSFLSQTFFCVFVSFSEVISGPVALKYIFNGLSEGASFADLFKLLLMISAAVLLRHLFGGLNEYAVAVGQPKIRAGMTQMIFDKAKDIDLSCYETSEFYNDFVWAASQADSRIFSTYNIWSHLIARGSDIIFYGGFIMMNDNIMFLFAAVTLVVRVICHSRIIKTRYQMDTDAKPVERERDYIQRVFYLSDYAKEIRLSDMHKTLFKKLKTSMEKIRDIYKTGGKKIMLYSVISAGVSEGMFTFSMLMYLCYKSLVLQSIMFGDLSALFSASTSFMYKVNQFINFGARFAQESLYIDKFNTFMNTESAVEMRGGRNVSGRVETLELKNVSFKYTGEKEYSLKDINIKIKPCEKIALVGYNGAGKSTLAKLLMNMYDVTEGEILAGGADIREFACRNYRSSFGSVFQDYKIFAGTIGENVVMDFVKDGDKERIISSLHDSGFDRIDEVGTDAQLTREFYEDGLGLSGGEEQKIAIARIFFRDCNYVILDEPSSALDPISEYNLNNTMMKLSENKTVIFISHRLSTVCMADRIYMLEKGRIIEEGSHDELMRLGGKYAEMFNKQAEKYRIG